MPLLSPRRFFSTTEEVDATVVDECAAESVCQAAVVDAEMAELEEKFAGFQKAADHAVEEIAKHDKRTACVSEATWGDCAGDSAPQFVAQAMDISQSRPEYAPTDQAQLSDGALIFRLPCIGCDVQFKIIYLKFAF